VLLVVQLREVPLHVAGPQARRTEEGARNDNSVVGHPGLVINPFLPIDTPDQR